MQPIPTRDVVVTPDGRRLASISLGEGPRLVVCEAGLGMSAHYWIPVMRHLAPHCRVVAYNRAGIGDSDPDPATRKLQRLANDLACVVKAQSYESVVLVGHSWGGPIVRTAQGMSAGRIERVAGLVLVDPSDEHLLDKFRPLSLALQRLSLVSLARLRLLSAMYTPILRGLSPDVMTRVLQDSTTVSAAREAAAELRSLRTGLAQLATDDQHYGSPVTVISGAQAMVGESEKMRAAIRKAHHLSAARTASAQLIVARDSGHTIPITEPEVVARAALALFDRDHFAADLNR